MKEDAQLALRGGLHEARKTLGYEVQEWFYQKYLKQSIPRTGQTYMQASSVPVGKIYFGMYDAPGNNKKGYWDLMPIIFHIDAVQYKNTDRIMIGLNLNYMNPINRAQFIDSISTYFERYITENSNRLEKGDYSQYSVSGVTEFLNGYIRSLGLSVSKTQENYIWSNFRLGTVVPIDYEDWKMLPLLVPGGVQGKPLSQIHNIR